MRFKTLVSLALASIMLLSFPVIAGDGNDGEIHGAVIGSPSRAPSFTNVSEDAGLAGYRGDNLAWGDYNDDQFLDLIVRGPASNYLFRNNGDGKG